MYVGTSGLLRSLPRMAGLSLIPPCGRAPGPAGQKYKVFSQRPSWLCQTGVLTRRTILNNLRNVGIFWVRLVMYLLVCLFIAFVNFQVGLLSDAGAASHTQALPLEGGERALHSGIQAAEWSNAAWRMQHAGALAVGAGYCSFFAQSPSARKFELFGPAGVTASRGRRCSAICWCGGL
jgi:hypothetical protein